MGVREAIPYDDYKRTHGALCTSMSYEDFYCPFLRGGSLRNFNKGDVFSK